MQKRDSVVRWLQQIPLMQADQSLIPGSGQKNGSWSPISDKIYFANRSINGGTLWANKRSQGW